MLSRIQIFLATVLVLAFFGGCSSPFDSREEQPSTSRVPRSVAGAESLYREAIKLIDGLEHAPAAIKLQQASDQFDVAGDDAHTAESMFWLGFCREKLGQDDPARQAYVNVIQRFPESKSAKSAQQRLDTMNQP